jgi:hypothetical protein
VFDPLLTRKCPRSYFSYLLNGTCRVSEMNGVLGMTEFHVKMQKKQPVQSSQDGRMLGWAASLRRDSSVLFLGSIQPGLADSIPRGHALEN